MDSPFLGLLKWVGYSILSTATVTAFAGLSNPKDVQKGRFRVTNQCEETLWIQQDFKNSTSDPIVVEIPANQSYDYSIPDNGLASTRFWPKKNCNEHGYNCEIGESVAVPEALEKGWQKPPFAPAIDSKFEASWGCAKAIFDNNPSLCAQNPSDPGNHLGQETWWNGSAVDGYTLPYAVKVMNHNNTCFDLHSGQVLSDPGVRCAQLDPNLCPSSANLSTEGKYNQINGVNVTQVNLQWLNQNTGKPVGCFSPCAKLTTAQGSEGGSKAGGWKNILGGLVPESNEAQMYCCPTPPVSSGACSAGPVSRSEYVQSVSQVQHCNSYTYAYDDAKGLAKCGPQTQFELIFCPSEALEGDSTNNNPPQSEKPTEDNLAIYKVQFNYNPSFGVSAALNETPLANAEALNANQFPINSVLNAFQGEKSADCKLTFDKNSITRGNGELCLRLNIVNEGPDKIHVYLPADIPDMNTGEEPPAIPQKIVFGMDSSVYVEFSNQILGNGASLSFDNLGNNSDINLVAHQFDKEASCLLKKSNATLSIVDNSGNLCSAGLVVHQQDNGDIFIGLPNPIVPKEVASSEGKSLQLGIASNMKASLLGQTIYWNSQNKTLFFPEGTTDIHITGINGQVRVCPITVNNNVFTWPQIPDCVGVVVQGDVMYFPAF